MRNSICLWLAWGVLTLPRGAALHGPDTRNLCKDIGGLSASAVGAAGTLSCKELEEKCQGEGLVAELRCGVDINEICCGGTGLSNDCGTFQLARCSTQPSDSPSPGSPSSSPDVRCGHGGFESTCAACTRSVAIKCNSKDCTWDPKSTPKCQAAATADQEQQGPSTAAIGGGVGGAVAVILIAVVACWLKPCGAPKPPAARSGQPPVQPPVILQQAPLPPGNIPLQPPRPEYGGMPAIPQQSPIIQCLECHGRPGGCAFCAPTPPPSAPSAPPIVREESSSNFCTICLTNKVRTNQRSE